MRKMKDSGIEWIGEIPKEWSVSKIKYHFFIGSGSTPKSDETDLWDGDIIWITPADFKTDDVYVKEGHRNISLLGMKTSSLSIVPAGNIIFSKRAPIGEVVINEVDLCTNQGCLTAIPKDDSDVRFYRYIMSVATEEFEILGSGTTFKEISASSFGNVIFPLVSVQEQQRRADFLDEKCNKIDAVIWKQEKVIEKLKEYRLSVITEAVTKGLNPDVEMKDSGIEWIGEIPRDWQVARLKYFSSVKTGPFGTQLSANEYVDEGIPCINVKNLGSGIIKAENLDFLPKSVVKRLSEHKLKENDIVFARKGSIDKHAIVSDKEAGWLQGSDCIRLRVNEKINPRYVNYYIESSCVKNYLNLVSNGATMASLSGGMIENIYIGFPDKAVQNDIVRSLDCKCNRIDIVIEERMKLIKKFKEIKNSIIYEVVTGKREV